MPTMLKLSHIVRSDDFQIRDSLDEHAIDRYTEAMQSGAAFPPIEVWTNPDDGVTYLIDGFHRTGAYERAGVESVSVTYFKGTHAEALERAIDCNLGHGVTMRPADIRRSCMLLMARHMADGFVFSTTKMADRFGVSRSTVHRWQQQLTDSAPSDPEPDTGDDDPLAGLDGDTDDTPAPPKPPEPKPAPKADPKKPVGRLMQITEAKDRFTTLLSALNRLEGEFERLVDSEYAVYLAQARKRWDEHRRAMREIIKSSAPAEVCRHCNGDGCKHCQGRGWISVDMKQAADD